MQKLGLAIVGAGSHYIKNIAPALNSIDQIKLKGVVNSTYASSKSVGEKIGIPGYKTLADLFKGEEVDIVYIATPPSLHFDYIQESLEAGKHVWVEKTFVTDKNKWLEIVELARQKDLQAYECFMFLHHPQFKKLQDLVIGGLYGDVRHIDARFCFPHLSFDNFRYNKKLGGGGLLDAGCYPLKAICTLLGAPNDIYCHSLSVEEVDVETSGTALLAYEKSTASITWGFGFEYGNEIDILFEQGRVKAGRIFSKPNSLKTMVEVFSQSKGDKTYNFDPEDHFLNMFAEFTSSIDKPELRNAKMEQDLKYAETLFNLKKLTEKF